MRIDGGELAGPVRIEEILARGLADRSDAPALVSRVDAWTWREFDAASARAANRLADLGLRPGDRLASLVPNRTSLIVLYLACLRAGVVAVPLNYRYTSAQIDHALAVCGASALVHHAERDADIAASTQAGRLPFGVISFEADDDRPLTLESILRDGDAAFTPPDLPDDAPAIVFFTSGSTGEPKGVVHSRRSIGWVFAAKAANLKATPDDTLLVSTSASHMSGATMPMAFFSAGATVAVARVLDADEILPLVREHRPTLLQMLPAALFALVRDDHATRDDFASFRYCGSGGDTVPHELVRVVKEKTGLDIHEGYGMTEFGVSHANLPGRVNKLGSIGTVFDGYAMSVRDKDGREIDVGEDGQMWVKTQAAMSGYWDRPQATAEVFVDGWIDTGDIVSVDVDGYAWYRGRKKQLIIHDGSNISPKEIEDALLEHPAVELAGVVGVHDLVHGENVYAYVSLVPGSGKVTGQQLVQFTRERVGYKAPEHVVFLDEMPLNAAGKVDRATLKEMAAQGGC
ncbi:MAG: class I adenylate-forming enzyme family protein [Planctomycetota bacterium]